MPLKCASRAECNGSHETRENRHRLWSSWMDLICQNFGASPCCSLSFCTFNLYTVCWAQSDTKSNPIKWIFECALCTVVDSTAVFLCCQCLSFMVVCVWNDWCSFPPVLKRLRPSLPFLWRGLEGHHYPGCENKGGSVFTSKMHIWAFEVIFE